MEAYGGASVSVCEDNEELDNLVLARAVVSHSNYAVAGTDLASLARHSCTEYLACGDQGMLTNGRLNVSEEGINKASTKGKGYLKVGIKRSLNSIRESGRGVKRSQLQVANSSVKSEGLSEAGPLLNRNKNENNVHAVQFAAKSVNAEEPGAALRQLQVKDVRSTVPIKKRRIHMADILQSPSPPPTLRSPGIESSPPSFPSPSLPPLSASSRSPSSLARLSLSSRPSILPSPRSPCVEYRSPLSASLGPLPMSSPRSPSPELRSPPLGSKASFPRSPFLGSAYPSVISHHLPNLVSLGCEPNYEAGDVTTSSGLSHVELIMDGNKQNLAVKSSILPTKQPSPRLFHHDNMVKEEDDEEEKDEGSITGAKGDPDVEDLDMVEESAREARMHGSLDIMGQQSCPEGIQGASGRLKSDFPCDDRAYWDLNMEMEAWHRLTDQTSANEFEDNTGREIPCTSISVDSNESRHDENVDVSAEVLVKVQAVDEYETEKCADLGTLECRDKDSGSVGTGEMMSMVLHNQSDWKAEAEGAADYVGIENSGSWEGETDSDGEADEMSWMEEEPQNNAPAGNNSVLKLKMGATSLRTKGTGWDQVLKEIAEENVDYGDSDWKDVEDVELDADEKASGVLQADINWSSVGETGNLKDNSDCQEVGTVSNEAQEKSGLCEEGLKASCCDSQLSELSFKKDGNSRRSKPTGWDQLPAGIENVEAWKVVQGSSSYNGRGGSWHSLQRQRSLISSRGSPRGSGLGSIQAASRDGFTSVRGERFFGNSAPDVDLLDTRKWFGHGRRLDDSHIGSSKRTPFCDRCPGGKFERGPVVGFHGKGRARRWRPGVSFGKQGSGWGGHANAAAVAAAKVQSKGFMVSPDGTITKAGGGIASSRSVWSRIAGRHGTRRQFTNVGRVCVDLKASMNFPARAHVGTSKRMVGSSAKVGMDMGGRWLGQNIGQRHVRSMPESGKLVGLGVLDKNQGGRGGMENRRNELPHRSLRVLDHSARDSCTSLNFRPDFKVGTPNTAPDHGALGRSKLVLTGVTPSQGPSSPSSKLSREKTGGKLLQVRESNQALPYPCLPARRTLPQVSYGSCSTDERDWHVSSEVQHSPSLRAGLNSATSAGKFGNCHLEIGPLRQNEDDSIGVTGAQPREGGEDSSSSPVDYHKARQSEDSLSKRERFKDNDRWQDLGNLSGKGGRPIRAHKLASNWKHDDDVAPRRWKAY